MDTNEFTLTLLRIRIGLSGTDTSRDLVLDIAWQTALDWAEAYCDRNFRGGEITEQIIPEGTANVSLRGYFVESITSVKDPAGVDVEYRSLNRPSGLLRLAAPTCEELTIVYNATPVTQGPVLLALLDAFDAAFATLSGEDSGGEVKGTSIDGMRVDFVTDNQDSTQLGGLPESVAAKLSIFRRMYC